MPDTSKKSVDLATKPILTISGHEHTVFRISYLADGKRFVTCSYDKTVRIWNVETGEQEGSSMEHDGWIEGLAVTKDEKRILGGGNGKALRIWDVETQQLIEEWDGDTTIRSIAVSPDGDLVASGHELGKITVREMDGGRVKYSLQAGSGGVYALCFSPDGTKLACGDDQAIRVFDLENGNLILGPSKDHARRISFIVWSLDATQFFAASWDMTIRRWDSETGEEIGKPWTGHTSEVTSISLSPDGTKLASVSLDHTVRFWATDSGDLIGKLLYHDHEQRIWAVTFSPSGEFVACGGSDQKVSIWRVPWWDDSKEHKSFLDLPAVTIPRPDVGRQSDYLDLPTNPSSPRSRMHIGNTQSSPSSRRPWRAFPHRLFGRLYLPPRRGEVTTVYPGILQQRVYVASRDDENTSETPTEPLPTAPGHYARFSIIVETISSSDSLDGDRVTAATPTDNPEPVQASCCSFLSRRRRHSGTASSPPAAMELTQHVSRISNPAPPLPAASSYQVTHNVLDHSAVVELPPGMA
ncbi:hypothetical protein PAXRUDRAFT_826106 [Paxillus rubicundulus Ve08.2h10]|uniref:WD40 repeat-like protein n=1 Tax=Paxillus rubicundulus Ve08.2h10 TaxID=930991 RepID=A0A0D0E4U4_9AGAM|nr:hypothetical protein PAXRUDRAFT_826106 [Paxillus rubicundulus Ve08.2h10]